MDAPATLAAASEASANSRTLRLSPPHPRDIRYSHYVVYDNILGEFNIRGVWGGLIIVGGGDYCGLGLPCQLLSKP